jgi:uncharacterized protein YecT (DUF1311 family)
LAVAGSACAIGLVVGLWAKPQFGADGRDRAPMKPVAAEPLDGAMQIVVDPPKTEVVAAAPGQLEVLPPDMAAAAAARRAIPAALPARQVQPEIRPLEPPPAPRMIETRRPAPAVRPSFDCRDARTEAEQMVCQDPSLAAADRRLARAFRRATDAGVPYEALRGEQDDWISIREAAARRSPEAVASIYDQRIEELEAMAEAPPDW